MFAATTKAPTMKNVYFFASVTLMSLIIACGGGETDEPTEPEFTATELALHGGDSKYWVLNKELYNGNDITASYQTCELDNVYILDKYENYQIDAGPTTCPNNPEADLVRGYYELDEVNNLLTLGNNDTVYTANLIEVASDILKWNIEVEGEQIERTFKPK